MKTEKRVTFDDGTEVTVTKRGEVVNIEKPNPVREFYDALRYHTEVEQPFDGWSARAYIGESGLPIKNNGTEDLFDLADEHGVEIIRLWPAFMQNYDTELPLYIRVREA